MKMNDWGEESEVKCGSVARLDAHAQAGQEEAKRE